MKESEAPEAPPPDDVETELQNIKARIQQGDNCGITEKDILTRCYCWIERLQERIEQLESSERIWKENTKRKQQRIEELERSERNCKAAVVLAREWLSEKDQRIEELKTEHKKDLESMTLQWEVWEDERKRDLQRIEELEEDNHDYQKDIQVLSRRIEELKQECERQHANTADQFDRAERLDAALREIEELSGMTHWPAQSLGQAIDIARKARARR